jgi:two-component system, chemotaxis family, sensor kinase Cph1
LNEAASSPAAPAVTLLNCDVEPIHIPGYIQPHGALLAFNADAALAAWSANAPVVLDMSPEPGVRVGSLGLSPEVTAAVLRCLTLTDDPAASASTEEITVAGVEYDLIAHQGAGHLIVEFERRETGSDEIAAFAQRAYRSIERVRRQRSTLSLLNAAVADIRALTGFDRVMAYRFRHDDSGDVVAESRIDSLEPNLGRRYPASDIPAQARRLYTINTLRLIPDVGYTPVPLRAAPDMAPLDLSYAVLRSVSPIHVEYLQNMGVGASMSISLVINGRLWGLIACHHMVRKLVPHSIRMACDVLAQVVASTISALQSSQTAARAEEAALIRTQLISEFLQAEDVMSALALHRESLCESLGAEALVVTRASKIVTFGPISESLSTAIVESLPLASVDSMVERTGLADWPAELRPLLGRWIGLLALHFDPAANGWMVALRPEQIETVRWGGHDEKTVKIGPLGARLTPRGSFAEWRETVRGRAEPWDKDHKALAQQLLGELHRAANSRHAEIERARTHLLAMLGHDLRDPLATISMAAHVLEQGGEQQSLSQRIQVSSGRMQRLINQVLDMSRVQGGVGLSVAPVPTDLIRLVSDILDEMRTANPDTVFDVDLPESATASVDPDRMGQVIANLLSNARNHGEAGAAVHLTLSSDGNRAVITVRNRAKAISPEVAGDLFSPFKRSAASATQNRTGLGLGLFIAHEIVVAHRGSLIYRYDDPNVVFAVELPV